MKKILNRFMFLLVIVSVVTTSAIRTTTVYADDGSTAPSSEESVPVDAEQPAVVETPASVSEAPEQVPTETEEVASDNEVDVEPASVSEVPEQVPTETQEVTSDNEADDVEPPATEAVKNEEQAAAPDEEKPAVEEPISVPEILEQLPAGTELVALNEAGDVEPLASEAAAQIIATSDPMWCPDGVTPGGAGCTSSFADFASLITALTLMPHQPPLYIAATVWSGWRIPTTATTIAKSFSTAQHSPT